MGELQRHLFNPDDISAEMRQYFEEVETECDSPWERVTEKIFIGSQLKHHKDGHRQTRNATLGQDVMEPGQQWTGDLRSTRGATTGWTPTCSCGTEYPIPQEELDADPTLLDDFEIEPFEPVPATVLDPFTGSGTVPDVARQLGRRWVGIDLSKEYCDEHIIPRLSEPLMEWAEQEQEQTEPEPIQGRLL